MYIYNKKSLTYNKIGFGKIFLLFSIIFLIGIILGSVLRVRHHKIYYMEKHIPLDNQNVSPTENKFYLDSIFTDYEKRAAIYLSRGTFKGTPLSSEILTLCARNTYDSTGVIVPIELVLVQAQFESSMGREGRSPKRNPFNLGESTRGATLWFKTTFDGVQAYYYLMANKYLKCRSVDELLINFVRCDGKRYAENPNYENLIGGEYLRIKRWIDRNI